MRIPRFNDGRTEKVGVEAHSARYLEKHLAGIEDQSIKRFQSSYGKLRTRVAYLCSLNLYRRWLIEEKGISLSFDELLKDNPENVYESAPLDVRSLPMN